MELHEHDGTALYSHASTCRECGFVLTFPVEVSAAFHPAAIAHLWEGGISLWELPLWEFFGLVGSGAITTDVRSIDPVDVRFELSIAGDRLRLEMGETLRVAVAAARRRAATDRGSE